MSNTQWSGRAIFLLIYLADLVVTTHYLLILKASSTTSVVDPAEIPDSGNVADAFGLSRVMAMPTASGYKKDIGF
nr:hypothetical protein CFP56_36819 [Quercus suber]POE53656.1 hypothetical protein CFP56_36820 [Quercus suber]